MSAYAWAVSIIAPIAGKPVMSLLSPAVATEPQIFHLYLDADARLAAAAGGVIRFLADAAGLDGLVIPRLQSAVVTACTEAFEHLSGDHARLKITFTRFSDRLEVALSHRGEASPAVGLDTIAGFAAQVGGAGSHSGVFDGFDRVQYETHSGETVTRLTKYLGGASPSV